MRQGQGSGRDRARRTRPGRRHRGVGTAAVAVLAAAAAGIGVLAAPAAPRAAAAPSRRPVGGTATGSTATTTTAVSPTTTVTTTTRPTTVTTTTTTVAAGPGSVTSTTVTTVAPTSASPGSTTPGPSDTSTTTTTTVPAPTTTTVPAPPAAPGPTGSPGAAIPAVAGPPPATFDPTCTRPATPDLQTYLDSLPPESTFRSSTTACYLVPLGIVVSKPITIIGGTFFDPTNTPTAGPSRAIQPIVLIHDTSHVTLSDVSVLGVNTAGTYHARLVNEAGIKVQDAMDVTLRGITSRNTFGDGLELVADSSHVPVTRLLVQGYTIVNAGRQAVTLAEVAYSVLDHVDIVSEADAGFDFESDLPKLGSGNVTISNCIDNHGFNMVEPLTGPVTVVNCTGFHRVRLGGPHGTAPVSFIGGSMTCRWRDPVPCIRQDGGSMTFTGVTITRQVGHWAPTTAVWAVRGAGHLTFVGCPIQLPMGWTADASTVTFLP